MTEDNLGTPAKKILLAYRQRLAKVLATVDYGSVEQLVELLLVKRAGGNKVFLAGNGGSASTCAHIAVDWMLGTQLEDPPLRALSLTDSASSITATGNDQTFERVFLRPFNLLADAEDLLVVLSASGDSENLVRLVAVARAREVHTVAVTAFQGGRLRELADLAIHVETEVGDYGVAEDIHLSIGHAVKEALIAAR